MHQTTPPRPDHTTTALAPAAPPLGTGGRSRPRSTIGVTGCRDASHPRHEARQHRPRQGAQRPTSNNGFSFEDDIKALQLFVLFDIVSGVFFMIEMLQCAF